ncbi:MAG: MlaD family protein [Saprospiraceae bacterium]|nr:MlaD family protein [Saprospiraceae bacterium]
MEKQTSRNIRLGLFVILGLGAIITLLYFIGSNQNLFGKNFTLEAHFKNVSGLRVGNNVRFSGIVIGTVKDIKIKTDTSVQVIMKIDDKLVQFLKQNDIASISTDGLMGNKVVDIKAGPPGGAPVHMGDRILTREALDMDEMMRTLDITNRNVAEMSEDLKQTVQRINHSIAVWEILNDPDLPQYVKNTLKSLQSATARANTLVGDVQNMVREVATAEGGVVALLKDSTLTHDLGEAAMRIRNVSAQAEKLTTLLDASVRSIDKDFKTGGGPLNALLRDSTMTSSIDRSLQNIEKGTDRFNETMEALKAHWLLRGYFKRQAKKAEKE